MSRHQHQPPTSESEPGLDLAALFDHGREACAQVESDSDSRLGETVFFLFSNSPVVVVGTFQSANKFAESHSIAPIRSVSLQRSRPFDWRPLALHSKRCDDEDKLTQKHHFSHQPVDHTLSVTITVLILHHKIAHRSAPSSFSSVAVVAVVISTIDRTPSPSMIQRQPSA